MVGADVGGRLLPAAWEMIEAGRVERAKEIAGWLLNGQYKGYGEN
jgi:hypothetical protein